jgi:predicted metal-dependent peptidase
MIAKEKVTKARTGLLLDSPFFGSLALRLKLVENTEQRIYTDGTVLSYDPSMIDVFTLPQVKGVLAHEVMHLAMSHHTRGKRFKHGTWNKAGDYAINGILIENRFELPEGVLHDSSFTGKAAEEIYNTLYARKPEESPNGEGKGNEGSQPDPNQGNGQQADQNGHGTQQNKSGQSNGQGEDDSPKWGQVEQSKDPAAQEQEWKIAVQQAAQAQKSRGEIPAGLKRMIQDILDPVIDWTTLLKDFLDRTARNDYNWSRPNPRYMQSGFILPSLISDELPEMIFSVDTSGSIDEADLAQIEPELQAVIDLYKTSIKVLYCDSELYTDNIQTFETGDSIKIEPIGGGGTDFRPVFKHIEESGESPTCLIYLTDMDGYYPDHEPDFPVLWINTGRDEYYQKLSAPFGETILMHPRG